MKLFFLFLLVFQLSMIYSAVNQFFFQKFFFIYYPEHQNNLAQNSLERNFCYEKVVLNSRETTLEEMIFSVVESTILGPQNIFISPPQNKNINVKKIHLFNDLLVIDFNFNLYQITPQEEEILLKTISMGIQKNFPAIKKVKWLIEGKKFSVLNNIHDYRNSNLIPLQLNPILAC